MKVTPADTGLPQLQPSFNRDAFLARVNNDRDQVLDLIDLFLEIYPDSLRRIEAAVQQQDADAILEAAHQFKGSLQFIHAEPAVAAAKKLERTGGLGEIGPASPAFDELLSEVEQLSRDLRAYVAASNS